VDLLAEPVRELLGDDARDDVGAAAGRERTDQLDGAARPGLRPRQFRQCACQERCQNDCYKMSAHASSEKNAVQLAWPQVRCGYPCTAAAMASPISCVLACPPRSRVRCRPSPITLFTAARMRPEAAVAFGSLRLRPSQPSSIWPDTTMA